MSLYTRNQPCGPNPQQRLWNQGPTSLSDSDLLTIVLGLDGDHAPKYLHRLASNISLSEAATLCSTSVKELQQTYGITNKRASALAAAIELGRRAVSGSELCITSPEKAISQLTDLMPQKKEHFRALYLDSKKRLIKSETISIGDLTSSIVHPREVFQPAIVNLADSLIIAHNHPSGDPHPSPSDIELTKRLQQAGDLLHITLVDHIIIGRGCYISMKQEGIL